MPGISRSLTAVLDRERTIAPPGFNRWLVPPAALAIHLSIGMAYGFSVFWLPLARAVGIELPASAAAADVLDRLQQRGGARQDSAAVFSVLNEPD